MFYGLSQAASALVVLIHGAAATVPLLEAALPGSRAVAIRREGSTPAYSEVAGLAAQYPTVRSLLAAFAPEWFPGQPLVLMAFSAGGVALSHYLKSAQDRSDVTAAIFLDSLYGAPQGECDLAPYAGVIEYGKLATANQQTKRLVMSYSHETPAPAICSLAIAAASGAAAGTGGVWLRDSGDSDHQAQQTVAGPAILHDLIASWIGSARAPAVQAKSSSVVPALVVLGVGAAIFYFTISGTRVT